MPQKAWCALIAAVLLLAGCESGAGPARSDNGAPAPTREPEGRPKPDPFPARVTRVIDGDTIEVTWRAAGRDRTEKVRLIGVNAPELSHPELGIEEEPYGREAAEYTRRVLTRERPGPVLIATDVQERDKYGRLLAYVWLARPEKGDEADVREKMLNARLLLEGYAQVMTVPPNVTYADLFLRFQAEARAAGRGLWGPKAPREGCDPSYPDVCIPPPPPDLDCSDIPHRRFRVLPPDPHHFDRDRDGVGCEG